MNTSSQNISLADYYFEFLKNLNADNKLDLYFKAFTIIKKSDSFSETTLQSLFGAYKSEETADEIIAEIRASRVFNRNIETL